MACTGHVCELIERCRVETAVTCSPPWETMGGVCTKHRETWTWEVVIKFEKLKNQTRILQKGKYLNGSNVNINEGFTEAIRQQRKEKNWSPNWKWFMTQKRLPIYVRVARWQTSWTSYLSSKSWQTPKKWRKCTLKKHIGKTFTKYIDKTLRCNIIIKGFTWTKLRNALQVIEIHIKKNYNLM